MAHRAEDLPVEKANRVTHDEAANRICPPYEGSGSDVGVMTKKIKRLLRKHKRTAENLTSNQTNILVKYNDNLREQLYRLNSKLNLSKWSPPLEQDNEWEPNQVLLCRKGTVDWSNPSGGRGNSNRQRS